MSKQNLGYMQLLLLHPAKVGAHGEQSSRCLCMKTVLHISPYRIADMVMICKANEGCEWPRYFLKIRMIGSHQRGGSAVGLLQTVQSASTRMKESSDPCTCWYLATWGSDIYLNTPAATGTVEEVSRLAGQAARVTPAVGARRRTAQTHTPAQVLVGALRTMSAAPVSETGREKK